MRRLKKKIFVLGNPLVKEDSIALRAAEKLRKRFPGIIFEEIDSVGSLKKIPKELVLMDAVQGIKKAAVLDDLGALSGANVFSLHDLDSGFQLKLLKKMGKIKKVKIIAIPQEMELEKAVEGAGRLLETIF